MNNYKVFDLESDVKSYCISYPVKFISAKNENLVDENGNVYLDFLSGAGSLNYGHNNPIMKEVVLEYIHRDGVIHGLDMMTDAKEDFIKAFSNNILKPRNLDYKIQFCGPTGTNAVEAAIKLARKITKRNTIFSFTRGFHGMTSGSLEATSNEYYKSDIGHTNYQTVHMPYCGYFGAEIDSIKIIERYISDPSSGYEKPAAMIFEPVQGEGGLNVASNQWLQKIAELCKKYGIMLIADDIQSGCGRTGNFFGFEEAGITPDMVLISKSISGYGLPMAIVLIKPELDEWKPAEHNGTFRGNNLAFITSAKMLKTYWQNDDFKNETLKRAKIVNDSLTEICQKHPEFFVKGKGMMQGIECKDKNLPSKIKKECFNHNLIIETSGPDDEVLKIFPPLTISIENLNKGLKIVREVINQING
jgi:diaminobutyrate-2-oxoglutarate transaminase